MKNIKIFVAILFAILIMPFAVNAATISVENFDDVKANNTSGNYLDFVGDTLELSEDLTLNAYLDIRSNVNLKLNGHTLTLAGHGNHYSITVFGNNTLTINGEGTIQVNDAYGITTSIVDSPKIIVNGGTFNQTSGYYIFALTNGEMTVNDGTFNAFNCAINNFAGYYREDPDGIYGDRYSSANGKLTINGGTFNTKDEWDTTIVNSDLAIINDGVFTSDGDYGIAILTTTTGTTIINKGKFNANGEDATIIYNEGTTTIKDGEYKASKGTSIYDDIDSNANAKTTTSGGTYVDSTGDVTPNLAEGYIQYRIDENTIAVGKSSMKLIVEAVDTITTEIQAEMDAIESQVAEGEIIGQFYEIDYAEVDPIDNIIQTISESPEELTITLDVSSFPEVESGEVRTYFVYRYHEGTVDKITNVTDNGDGTITFKSSKFSTYAVVYEDSDSVQPREDDIIPTDEISGNPKTSDDILQYVTVAFLSLFALGFIMRKQFS